MSDVLNSPYEALPPVPATALLVDLRNFTPNLSNAASDAKGVNVFCHFLARIYARCLEACSLGSPPSQRKTLNSYANSTGDGVLAVFLGEAHYLHGFLAAVIMHNLLKRECAAYNNLHGDESKPPTSFGIGVESGQVSWVRAHHPFGAEQSCIETCIGDCINIAARAETVSKLIHKANTIIAGETIELCCLSIFGESHRDLISRARDDETNDHERLALYDRATEQNRSLCLAFLENHIMKGVPEPAPLYKLGDRSAQLGNPRLNSLIGKLTNNDKDHHSEVMRYLTGLSEQ